MNPGALIQRIESRQAVVGIVDVFDYPLIVKHAKLVLDTRNATKNVREGREKIFKA